MKMKRILYMPAFQMSKEAFFAILQYGGMPCAMFIHETVESAARCIAEARPDEVLIDDGFVGIGGEAAYLALREVIGNTPARVMASNWPNEDRMRSFDLRGIPYGQYNELIPAKRPAVSS